MCARLAFSWIYSFYSYFQQIFCSFQLAANVSQNGSQYILKYCFQGKLLYFDSQVPLNNFPANSTDSKSVFILVRAWCCGAKGHLLRVNIVSPLHQHTNPFEWVIKFNSSSETEIFSPTSSVIITYTLESLSSFTQITHILQVTIDLKEKKGIQKKKSHKTWGPPLSWHHWSWELCISLQSIY